MKLILIRHGETEINTQNLTHKTGDAALLTSLGKKQAEKTATALKSYTVDAVFSSPEARCLETAAIIGHIVNLPVKQITEFRERNWGEWEGKPWPEIEVVLKNMTLEERYNFMPPGGESWMQAQNRIEGGLKNIEENTGDCAAIITHGGTLRAAIPILLNGPRELSFKYVFDNCSISVFQKEEGMHAYRPVIINDTRHLQD